MFQKLIDIFKSPVGYRIVGVLALCVLAVWIVISLASGDLAGPRLKIELIGNGFDGNLALPKEVINAKLANARDQVTSLADYGRNFRITSRIAAWLVFFATAAITLVAGWYGQSPQQPGDAGQGPQPITTGLPRGASRVVTLLAALAAVLTAGGGMATQEAERLTASAREKHRIVVDARSKVVAAKDAEEATTTLDDLDLAMRQ